MHHVSNTSTSLGTNSADGNVALAAKTEATGSERNVIEFKNHSTKDAATDDSFDPELHRKLDTKLAAKDIEKAQKDEALQNRAQTYAQVQALMSKPEVQKIALLLGQLDKNRGKSFFIRVGQTFSESAKHRQEVVFSSKGFCTLESKGNYHSLRPHKLRPLMASDGGLERLQGNVVKTLNQAGLDLVSENTGKIEENFVPSTASKAGKMLKNVAYIATSPIWWPSNAVRDVCSAVNLVGSPTAKAFVALSIPIASVGGGILGGISLAAHGHPALGLMALMSSFQILAGAIRSH